MPNTNTSPNMTIVVPVPTIDPGPEYATYLYTALYTTVDQHNHTTGKGVPVPASGLTGTLLATQFPALTGDVTTVAGSLSATLAATTNATLGSLTKSSGVAIAGSNTNDTALAGYVGEFIQGVFSTAQNVPGSTTAFGDMTSISLTAGDWDVSLVADFVNNGASATFVEIGISTTTGNSATGLNFGDNRIGSPWSATAGTDDGRTIPSYRMSFASTTTVYAKIKVTYSAGNPQYRCRLSARRVR